jgi:hypothetical protein
MLYKLLAMFNKIQTPYTERIHQSFIYLFLYKNISSRFRYTRIIDLLQGKI